MKTSSFLSWASVTSWLFLILRPLLAALLLGFSFDSLFITSVGLLKAQEALNVKELPLDISTERGLSLDIEVPDEIFLTIPSPQSEHIVSVTLRSALANHTNSIITTQMLMPELSTNSRLIKPMHHISGNVENSHSLPLEPGDIFSIPLRFNLFWQSGKLHFQNTVAFLHTWVSDPLIPEDHQLSFAYEYKNRAISSPELLKIHLVEPLSVEDSIVEIDGIQFQVLVSQPKLKLQSNSASMPDPIEFQLRITNKSQKSIRLNAYDGLSIQLLDSDNQEVRSNEIPPRLAAPREYLFPLIKPGENFALMLTGKLLFHEGKHYLQCSYPFNGSRSFYNLEPGSYQVQLTYMNFKSDGIIYDNNSPEQRVVNDFLKGLFVLLPVELTMIE